MAAKKKITKKAPAKKAPAKKAPAKKAPAKKAVKMTEEKTKKSATASDAAPSLVGKKAPSFKLLDQNGETVSSTSLKGSPYVIYFYPKDNTPGCTQEACDFRDGIGNFLKQGVTVLGVSPDSEKTHLGFATKHELPFSLLADSEKSLAQAYGVWALKKNYGREYWGIVRSTFLVDKAGKVVKEWRGVRVKGHVDAVFDEAVQL